MNYVLYVLLKHRTLFLTLFLLNVPVDTFRGTQLAINYAYECGGRGFNLLLLYDAEKALWVTLLSKCGLLPAGYHWSNLENFTFVLQQCLYHFI